MEVTIIGGSFMGVMVNTKEIVSDRRPSVTITIMFPTMMMMMIIVVKNPNPIISATVKNPIIFPKSRNRMNSK